MSRCAIYARVSTNDQSCQPQLNDLRALAQQRGLEIIDIYTDTISGTKAKRPGLNHLLDDARRGRFDVLLIWSFDRLARSVRHLLETLDELTRLNIQFVSFRESIDTGGPLGRAIVVIIGAIAELERSLIVERVRCGMRRARLEGRQIGRRPLDVDHAAVLAARAAGLSLGQIAKTFGISRASVSRILKLHGLPLVPADPDAAVMPN
jgi:DNA invertase Pin-like site-specific DNA recombinase